MHRKSRTYHLDNGRFRTPVHFRDKIRERSLLVIDLKVRAVGIGNDLACLLRGRRGDLSMVLHGLPSLHDCALYHGWRSSLPLWNRSPCHAWYPSLLPAVCFVIHSLAMRILLPFAIAAAIGGAVALADPYGPPHAVTDMAPFCASCHSSVNVAQLTDLRPEI